MVSIKNINDVAVVKGEGVILTDVQSALDLIGTVSYQTGCDKIVLFKENIAEDFFKLSTGKLGEVLQKFVTYGISLSIAGDFSLYKSPSLKAFIYESNKGNHIYFAVDEQSAIEKLENSGNRKGRIV